MVAEIDAVLAGERRWCVVQGDCLEVMAAMPAQSVQCCVTSPPYWGLRKYECEPVVWGGDASCEHEWSGCGTKTEHPRRDHSGYELMNTRGTQGATHAAGGERCLGISCLRCGAWRGQLGLEPTPALYVQHIVSIFREVRRVLRDDGTLWLNIGDCYAGGGCGSRDPERWPKQSRNDHMVKHAKKGADAKPKDLIGTPWLLAFALRDEGWFLRSEIIWFKPACMPESVRDRPTRSHEQVFLLTKSASYFYDAEAASEAVTGGAHARGDGVNPRASAKRFRDKQNPSFSAAVGGLVDRRNWRTVWTIAPEPTNEQHFAAYPSEIPRRCIVAGTRPGDVVLDPFSGTARTGTTALRLGRRYVGIDLSTTYCDIGTRQMRAAEVASGTMTADHAASGEQIGLLGHE